MTIQEIKFGKLSEFLNSDLYAHSNNIPITHHRALSQLKNPSGKSDDIILIIAVNDHQQITGFIGALPEQLASDPSIHLAWNSCWWVDPDIGKNIAMPLFFKFLSRWKNVMFRELTPHTKELIHRMNRFQVVKPLHGKRYFLRLNLSEVLPKRASYFKWMRPLLYLTDWLGNGLLSLKHRNHLYSESNTFKAQYVDHIDPESENLIRTYSKNQLFVISKEKLEWIYHNPWVIPERDIQHNSTQNYYFSSTSQEFQNYFVKLYHRSNDQPVAFLFLSKNNGMIKLLYAYYGKEHTAIVTEFLSCFLVDNKAVSFVTYHASILEFYKTATTPFWTVKPLAHELVVSRAIADKFEDEFEFHGGEGDFGFV